MGDHHGPWEPTGWMIGLAWGLGIPGVIATAVLIWFMIGHI